MHADHLNPMSPIELTIAFVIAACVRLTFLWSQLSKLDLLWTDYDRKGLMYQMAKWLDRLTLLAFAIPALLTLLKIRDLEYPLTTSFIVFLGIQLLSRLKAHCFPRTNLPGAFDEAKVDLIVHLLMGLAGAVGLTIIAAIYLWWSA
ncbi:MAG: hypothetical protein U0930_13265 [Pirellulales bacterium]